MITFILQTFSDGTVLCGLFINDSIISLQRTDIKLIGQ